MNVDLSFLSNLGGWWALVAVVLTVAVNKFGPRLAATRPLLARLLALFAVRPAAPANPATPAKPADPTAPAEPLFPRLRLLLDTLGKVFPGVPIPVVANEGEALAAAKSVLSSVEDQHRAGLVAQLAAIGGGGFVGHGGEHIPAK